VVCDDSDHIRLEAAQLLAASLQPIFSLKPGWGAQLCPLQHVNVASPSGHPDCIIRDPEYSLAIASGAFMRVDLADELSIQMVSEQQADWVTSHAGSA